MNKYKVNVSVCLMLMNEDNVLLLRRCNTSYENGKYEFPSGHIEEKETLIEAAAREALEETGVTVDINNIQFVGCVDNNTSGKHINILFKANKYYGEPKLIDGEESDDITWKKLTDLYNDVTGLSIDTIRSLEMAKENINFKSYTGKEKI
jgi:ADP-ribose pyrophosphatase YjhB (NUDIX family)